MLSGVHLRPPPSSWDKTRLARANQLRQLFVQSLPPHSDSPSQRPSPSVGPAPVDTSNEFNSGRPSQPEPDTNTPSAISSFQSPRPKPPPTQPPLNPPKLPFSLRKARLSALALPQPPVPATTALTVDARVLRRRTDTFWNATAKARVGSQWWKEDQEEMKLEREGRVNKAAEREVRNAAAASEPVATAEPALADSPAADDQTEDAAGDGLDPTTNRISALPQSETELHRLLINLSRAEPPISPVRLAALHGHAVLRPLASSRTYGYLLHLAVKHSNQRLAQALLHELDERGLARTEAIWRTLLRARMRVGSVAGVREAVAELRRQGVRPVVSLNWRRDLSQADPDAFDPSRRFWPEWDPTAHARELQGAGLSGARAGAGGSRGKRQTSTGPVNSTLVFSHTDTLFTRQRTRVGSRDPTKLAAADITAVVHSLILDGAAPDAFDVAERWLLANKPAPAPAPATGPSPERSHCTASPSGPALDSARSRGPSRAVRKQRLVDSAYAKTTVVLLNILLRSWVATHPPPPDRAVHTFLLAFAARHGVRPGESTLRTLVDGFRGRRAAWLQAKATVEWFVRHFGIPGTPAPPPLPVPGSAAEPAEPAAHLCSSQVGLLLLHLAVHQPIPPEGSEYRRKLLAKVRTWWAQVRLHRLATRGSLGALGFRRAELLVDKAVRKGVLEEPEGWRAKEEHRKRKAQKEEARRALCE